MNSPVLGIDCSTTACSAACWHEGTVLAREFVATGRGQAEMIMPMIARVMDRAGLAFAALGLVAVSVGPGAFTGLRIGLSAAKGLALAAGLPLAGISSTLAVAAAVPEAERQGRTIIAAVESKRAEIYCQAFDPALHALDDVAALAASDAALAWEGPVVLAGERAAELAPLMPGATMASSLPQPDAAVIAGLAGRLWPAGTLPPVPLYLRPPDVTLPS